MLIKIIAFALLILLGICGMAYVLGSYEFILLALSCVCIIGGTVGIAYVSTGGK